MEKEDNEQCLTENWKVNTPELLKLLVEDNPKGTVLRSPVRIFQSLLIKLTERALVINDKELNDILLSLNLIEVDEGEKK